MPPSSASSDEALPPLSAEIESALVSLGEGRRAWARTGAGERQALLDRCLRAWSRVASRWVEANLAMKGIDPASPAAAEEWFTGPYLVHRNLRLLRDVLGKIARYGRRAFPAGSAPSPTARWSPASSRTTPRTGSSSPA